MHRHLIGCRRHLPMMGAQRRVEARIGQLLGAPETAQLAGKPLSHAIKVERPNDRCDFRQLARGLGHLTVKRRGG
jgi:hypothetical protein